MTLISGKTSILTLSRLKFLSQSTMIDIKKTPRAFILPVKLLGRNVWAQWQENLRTEHQQQHNIITQENQRII